MQNFLAYYKFENEGDIFRPKLVGLIKEPVQQGDHGWKLAKEQEFWHGTDKSLKLELDLAKSLRSFVGRLASQGPHLNQTHPDFVRFWNKSESKQMPIFSENSKSEKVEEPRQNLILEMCESLMMGMEEQ